MNPSTTVFDDVYTTVSSAYIIILHISGFMTLNRSFTNIIKSVGPKMDPCGTPVLIVLIDEH